MAAPVIEACGVGRRFAGVHALDDISFNVVAGEAVAVFGPNGAGKTTLLRLCATLLRASAGELRLFGSAVRDGGVQARRRIGMLSHQSLLYPDLTPTENLEFYARMYGVRRPAKRVGEWIDTLGLRGWAHRPLRTLSRGLEQRCALARALLHDPELLLLDEPFTGLDAEATAMLIATLQRAHRQGATVMMTTHDVERGFAVCGRALLLVQGRLTWTGMLAAAGREAFLRQYAAVRPAAGTTAG
jgi:heme exporter protein A